VFDDQIRVHLGEVDDEFGQGCGSRYIFRQSVYSNLNAGIRRMGRSPA
jgi:hypothetical protein